MFRWEKQKDGNYFAYSGQVTIGMVVKMHKPFGNGATHAWSVSAISRRTWLKTNGHLKSMASGKRAVKRCWTDWCEVHGLAYKPELAGVEGIESSSSVLETDALPLS